MVCCECTNKMQPEGEKIKIACTAYPEKEIELRLDHAGYFEKIGGEWRKMYDCDKRTPRAKIIRGGYHG